MKPVWNFKSIKFRVQKFQEMERVWKAGMTAAEFSVATMIYDRTLGWGKQWEAITLDQFQHGVCGKSGKEFHAGCGLGRRTIMRAVGQLCQKGFVLADRMHGEVTRFSLQMGHLKLPKKKSEEGPKWPETGAKMAPPRGPKWPTKNSNKKNSKIRSVNHSPAAKAPTVEEVQEEHRQRRVTRRMRLLQDVFLSADEMQELWNAAWANVYPTVPAVMWKVRERKIMAGYRKRWVTPTRKVPFGEYLDWSVRSWDWIMDQAFTSMRSKPPLPSVPFFVRFSDTFENIFAHRADQIEMMSKSTREREIQRRVRKGMPVEVAEEEVDQASGISRQRQELAKERGEVSRERRLLAVTQDDLHNMVEREIERRGGIPKLPGTAKERLQAERAGRSFATSDYERNGH